MFKYFLIVLSFSTIVLAQRRQRPQSPQQFQQPQYNTAATTPVPILRQINTHNDDGSYTYGYEGADGSYKVETKAANGEVRGKYGYYDDVGQLREIEYGATKDGFVPSGTDVRPPVIPQNTQSHSVDYDDDGQYRPEVHERPYDYQPEIIAPNANLIQGRAAPRALGRGQRRQQRPRQQQVIQHPQDDFYSQQQYSGQYFEQQPQQQQYSSGQYFEQPQQQYQPQPALPRSFSTNSNAFTQPQRLHPAVPSFNLETGSYSIRY